MAADVLLLYGMSDEKEMVAQFFSNRDDLENFRKKLPGRYHVMGINGIYLSSMSIVSVEVPVDLDDDDPYNRQEMEY